MSEGTKTLAILQMAISADTADGSVRGQNSRNPRHRKRSSVGRGYELLSTLVPPSTPATLKGLVQILGGLMRMSNKATASHHDSITSIL